MPRARRIYCPILFSAVATMCSIVTVADAEASEFPNVLFILSDQHRADFLEGSGGLPVRTPHLDRMASEGIQFMRCISASPVCTPTRATLQTGYYPAQHQTYTSTTFMDPPGTKYFAEVFAQAGYATGYSGKWHLNGTGIFVRREQGYVPPGARRRGYQEWWGYDAENDHSRPTIFDESQSPPALRDVEGYDWAPTWQTDTFLDFARRHRDEGRPWMFFLSYGPPHGPPDVPQRFLDLYDRDALPIPPNLAEALPTWAARGVPEGDVREALHYYYAMVSFLDDEVGRTLDGLDALGLSEDTIVVYLSDHGDLLGAHPELNEKFREKSAPYAAAFRIPFIVRRPGTIPAGITTDTLVSTVDVPATVLELAGLPVPRKMQGVSMRAWCLGEDGPAKDAVYLDKGWEAVWTGDFIYSPGPEYRILYDHRVDPYELDNLFESPDHVAVRGRLDARLAELSQAAKTVPLGPTVCDDAAKIESQLKRFLDRYPAAGEIRIDAMPLGAYVALLQAVGCDESTPYGEVMALRTAYNANLDAFDANDFISHHPYRELVAALSAVGIDLYDAVSKTLSADDAAPPLSRKYYQFLRSIRGNPVAGVFVLPSAYEIEDAAERRGTHSEALLGSADYDRDGDSNMREYLDAIADGGTLGDFTRAATDPEVSRRRR